MVVLMFLAQGFFPVLVAGADNAGVSHADAQYSPIEFAEFLAISLVANQLLIARRLTEEPMKSKSFQNYLSTVFVIWASNRAMSEPILKTETVDALLRALAEQPEILASPGILDDPLLLSSTPKDEWLLKLQMLAGFPDHLTKLYTRQLNGDYAGDTKVFRESVVALIPEKKNGK